VKLLSVVLALALVPGCSFAGPLKGAIDSYLPITDTMGVFHCGATAVGKRTVVTAEHCVAPNMLVEGQVPSQIEYDGAEHALILLPKPHGHKPAKLAHRLPQVGDTLWMVGRPADLGLIFRTGYYQGEISMPNLPSAPWRLVSFVVAGGDSGSGIYNSKNELIGTVSIQVLPPDMFIPGWAPLGYTDYKFTAEQWKLIYK